MFHCLGAGATGLMVGVGWGSRDVGLCTGQASGKPRRTVGVRGGGGPTQMHVLRDQSPHSRHSGPQCLEMRAGRGLGTDIFLFHLRESEGSGWFTGVVSTAEPG